MDFTKQIALFTNLNNIYFPCMYHGEIHALCEC